MLKKNKVVAAILTMLVALCLLLGISLFGCQDATTSTSSLGSVDSSDISSTAVGINPNVSPTPFSSSSYTTVATGPQLVSAVAKGGTQYIKLQEGKPLGESAIGLEQTLIINSGVTINLDLNGRVIGFKNASAASSTSGCVFYINGGTLNIYDSRSNQTAWFYNTNGTGGSFYFQGSFSAETNNWIYGGFIMGGTGIKSGNNYMGGCIYLNSGTVNMYQGSIVGNAVSGNNGATGSHGGGVYVNNGTFNMYGGGIFGNYANGYGGGVYVGGSGAFKMIPNGKAVQVSYNVANVGGGVYVGGSGANTFTGGEINYNKAGIGGGLYVASGKTIANNTIATTISGNTASSGDGGGIWLGGDTRNVTGTVSYNSANGRGAGIYKDNGTLNFSGNLQSNGALGKNNGSAVFNNNGAFNMTGGSIKYNKGIAAVYMNGGTFNMSGGSIYRNIANKGQVAGVYIPDGITSIGVSGGAQIKENFAGDNLSIDEGSGAIANAMASTSSASNLYMTVVSARYLGVNTLTSSADIRVSLSAYTVGTMVTMNYGKTNGSSSHVSEYITLDNPSYGVEQKMGTTGNEAWVVNAVATVRTETNYFHAGYQTLYYAANRYNKYSNDDAKVLQLIADNSVANTGALSQNGIVDLNGYIMSYTANSGAPLQINAGSTVTLKDSRSSVSTYKYTWSNNTSPYVVGTTGTAISGGVITGGKQGGIYVLGTLNMQAGTLAGNVGQGGLNIASGGTVNIQGNVNVEGNTSTSNGGGIIVASGATLDAQNQNSYNLVVRNNYSVTNGGGIYALGTVNLYKGTVQNNRTSSAGTGGGIYVGGSSDSIQTVIGAATISNNYAPRGGGIYVASGKLNYAGSTANTTGNTAQDGAGIYVAGGVAALGAGQISGNTATGYGAGLYVINSTNVTISNHTISGNATSGTTTRGAGIYLKSGKITMTSGSIKTNTCAGAGSHGGGGVFVESGEFAMSGGEVTLNAGIGGGIRASGGTVNLSGTAHVNKNVSTSDGAVAGVHIETNATIKIGDSVQVTGNVRSGTLNSAKTDINENSGTVVDGSKYYNLYLVNNKVMTVTSALTADADIGISMQTMPSTTAQAITSGYTGTVAPENVFSLDPTNTVNIIVLNNSEASVALAVASVTIGSSVTYYNSFKSALATYNGNATGTRVLQLLGNNTTAEYSEFTKSGNLDLNGYILQFTGASSTNAAVIGVASGVNLTIEDSTSSRTHYYTKGSNGAYSFFASSGAEQAASGSNGSVAGGIITGGTGGGLYIKGTGTITMQAGTIAGNTVKQNNLGAGATIVAGGTLTLNGGTKIVGNASPSYIAGGVNIAGAGTLTMTGTSSIANNVAATYGGGVHIGNGGTLSMSGNSTITGNSLTNSTSYGGGVYSNSTSTINLTGSARITDNSAKSNGGGIFSSGALTMSGSVAISGNNTVSGVGGGIYVKDGTSSTIAVSGSVSVNNNTKGTSDAADNIYLATGKSITVAGTISNGAHLGVTLQTPTSGTIVATSFGSHSQFDPADILNIDDTGVSLGLSLQNGNVILGEIVAVVTSGTSTQEFGTITAALERFNAITTDDNKVLQLRKDVSTTETAEITVSGTIDLNGHILDCKDARGNVSTIWVSSSSATLTIIDSTPTTVHYYTLGDNDIYSFQDAVSSTSVKGGVITGGHTTNGSGGGVYVEGTLIMKGGTIAGNESTYSAGCGGGVFVKQGASFTMKGGTIAGNYAAAYGGGVNVEAGGMFIFNGGEISHNTATNGGGISAMGAKGSSNAATVVITQGINDATSSTTAVSANSVSRYGGGLYIDNGASVIMQGGSIDRNIATISSGNSCFGGGVYMANGSLTMSGGVIEKNYSKTYGAGVYMASSTSAFTMNGTATVQGNYAASGAGGIQADNGTLTINGNAQVIDNRSNRGSIAGVHVAAPATITIGGSVKIWNNLRGYSSWNAQTYTAIEDTQFDKTTGSAKNLYIVNGTSSSSPKLVTISPALTTDSYIGISFFSGDTNMPTRNDTVFTSGYDTNNHGQEPSDYFLLDDYSTEKTLESNARAIKCDPTTGELIVTDAIVSLVSPANNYAQGYAAFSTAVARYNRLTDDDNKVLTLLADAPVSAINTINENGTLDLDGHILYNTATSTGVQTLVINSEKTFTIKDGNASAVNYYTKANNNLYSFFDSTNNNAKYTSGSSLSGGVITGAVDTAIVVKGNLIIEGGSIAGNSASSSGGCGGAINVYPNGTLTLQSGAKIVGNVANGSGAAIYANSNVTINGATISENYAAVNGAGIYMASGTLTVNGGTISSNSSRNGAGIYLYSGTATLNSTSANALTISKNFALGNNSSHTTGNGGALFVYNANLTINGGLITNNRGLGAGAYIYNGSFTMTGGSITKNGSPTDGSVAGVHFDINGNATVAISGTARITENYSDATQTYENGITIINADDAIQADSATGNRHVVNAQSNLYLPSSRTIDVSAGLREGALISVSPQYFTIGKILTSGYTAADANTYFALDNNTFTNHEILLTKSEDGEVMLAKGVATVAYTVGSVTTTTPYLTFEQALTEYNAVESSATNVTLKLLQGVSDDESVVISNTATFKRTGTFDINGIMLKYDGTQGSVVQVGTSGNNVTLTMIDSSPSTTHSRETDTSSEHLTGGLITGGKGVAEGGGVNILSGSTFKMQAGNIANNSASSSGGAINVATGATLEISGGRIAGNYVTSTQGHGGGVYVADGAFVNMSGSPTIMLNYIGGYGATANNLELGGALVKINLVGAFGDNAMIGVTLNGTQYGDNADNSLYTSTIFTSNYIATGTNVSGRAPSEDFVSDVTGYVAKLSVDDPTNATWVRHNHDWSYSYVTDGSGNNIGIKATCNNTGNQGDTCPLSDGDGGTLSIAAPTGAEYNGVSGHAIEEGGTMTADAKKAAMYTVTYTYKEKESDTPEDTIKTIDAGYYEATLTLHAADLSLTTSYQVAKATLYIAANDNTIVYGNDGANAGVTVTGLLGNDSAEVRVRTDSDKTDVSGANITAVISFTYLTDSGATYQAGDGVGVNYSIVPAIDTTLSYAKNYNFDYYTTADDAHAYYGVLTVKQRSLYITSISADDKFYDGTTWAQLYVTLRDGDLLEKDKDLVTINVTGAFTTKDVEVNSDGTPKAKTVKMTGATLQGATANIQNYVIAGLKDDALNAAGKTSATIKPVAINVDGIIAIDKVYDGTKTTYYSANNARFSGDKYITSDNVTIADIKTVEFDSADVAYVDGVIVAKTVTFSNFVLGGNDGINYYIEGSLQSTAKITPISITIEGVTAYNKIYDGTTVATIDFTNAKVSGVLSQDGVLDDVKVNDAKGTAAFKTASQGTGKTVEISGLEITGAKAGNYTYNYDTIIVTSADISRRVIYVNGGITASGKEYDKTTDVDVYDFSNATFAVLDKDGNVITDLPEAIANDINGSDRITIMASLEFTSANAGENVPINVTIVELLGTNADNYTLLDRTYHAPDGLSATITKRVVIAGNVLVDDKDYDKNTTATPIYESLEFTRPQGYSGKAVMDGDILTVNATAEFDTPNAGDDIPVHITIVGLAGEAADNYMLDPNTTEHADAYASIRPIGITVSGGIVATERVYNGGTDVLENVDVSGAQFTGVKDGDEVKIDKFTAHMKDKNVGEAKDVDIVFLSLAGADAGNYYLADDDYEGALTIKITHVTITMTGEGIIAMDKVHDGTTAAEIEVQNAKFDGVLDGDLIGVTIRGEFESSDANDEEAQSITITRALLTGQDAGNYILDESALRAEGESVGYTAPKAFIFKREIAGPSSAEYSITLTYNGEYRTSTELAKLTGVERSEGQLNEASEFVAGETDNVVKNAGTYTIRLTLQDPVNTRWADGVNATGVNDNIGSYIDFTVIVNPLLITKPTADTSEFVYNGVEQTYNVQGNAEESKWYTVTGNKQTSGTHEVTVELTEPGNVMWDDGTTAAITFEFVITGDPASPIFWLEILIGAGILFELFWMITLIASKNKNKKNGTTNAIAPLPLLAVGALLATIPNWEFWLILVLAVVLIVLLVVLVISTQIYFKNRRQAKDGDRIESEGVSYELTDGEYYSVDGIGTCSQTELVISAYVDGVPVKRIKAGAFSNCMQLTKLYVPSTIEEIGVGAFEGCDNLMDATFSRQGGGKWTVSLDGSKGKNITSKLKKNGHAAKLLTLDLAKYYWIKK